VRVNDLYVYSVARDMLLDGNVPYRDWPFEYPPLALVPIGLAGGDAIALSLLMLGCALACQAAAWALGGPASCWLMVALPPVAGALVRTHFDLLPAALTLIALVLLARGRPTAGLTALGLGTMTKLWPAAVTLIALAWLVGAGRIAEARRALLAFVAVVAVIGVPFAVAGGFPSEMVRFHLERPVQIESTPASVLELIGGSYVTGAPVRPDRFKSNGLDGGAAGAVALLFNLALVAATAWLVVLTARRAGSTAALLLGAFAVTLAFVALGKVLSPQYVCWLLPLAAVAWSHGARAGAALTAAASLVTQLWFPARYFDVVFQESWAISAVAVRNALLLAALAATARALARCPRPAAAPRRSG